MSDVVPINCETTLPISPAKVLNGALQQPFERVLVIGVTKDGEEFYASSEPDAGVLLFDMERTKWALMKLADDE